MGVATTAARGMIRAANSIVNLAVLVLILLLLVFGGYALWDSGQVYHDADAAQYAKYKPTQANKGLSFAELQAINPEVISWLTVYGTHIDYPVAQGADNLKYVNTSALGKYSLSGSLFLDADCSADFSDFSSIIYGHHMDKNTMFGEIGLFADTRYFNARRYGVLYAAGRRQGLEFFAFLPVDAYDSAIYRTKIVGDAQRQAYLNLLLSRATNVRRDVKVTPDDRIVLLSTCASGATNGRSILVAKIIDRVPEDPFKGTGAARRGLLPSISALPGLWRTASIGVKIALVAAPFLLIVVFVVFMVRRKKKGRVQQPDEGNNS